VLKSFFYYHVMSSSGSN